MDVLNDFLNWAWARHQNPLSWYIRPLFILPFCYFAYKKSVRGIVLTLVAVTSSMFWFPVPATPDPRAVALLDVERIDVGKDRPDHAHSDLVRRLGVGRSKTLMVGSCHGHQLRDVPEGGMALP